MQLGMMNDPRRNASAEARWAAANGFEFLDLTIEGPGAALEQIDRNELHAILNGAGMGVVGHTAWYLPFAAPLARVRQAAVESVVETFELFVALGAQFVNVHLAQGVPLFPKHSLLSWQGECFATLAECAEPYGLRVMIEHPPDPSISVSDIGMALNADQRLGFHLDVGHANVGGDRLEGLLNHFGARLAHVHMSDNRGRSDDHLPLGVGNIDWARVVRLLKARGYDHTITLEVFSADRDYLLASSQKLRRLWNTEGENP